MRIYLDVLMITNGIISLIFINCISKITHTKVTNLRMLLSCFIGGASSLLMIINTSSFLKSLGVTSIKFIAVIIIMMVSFKCKTLKDAIKYIFLYVFLDLVFSGLCLLIWQITDSKLIYIRNYTVYFNISIIHMIIAVILIYITISIYEWILRRKFNRSERYKAIYSIGNYEIEINAISDSGNSLCDPFTGTPVVIFCCNELFDHFNLENENLYIQNGFRLTPYTTVLGKSVIPVTSKGNVKIVDSNENIKDIKCCVGIKRCDNEKSRAIFNPCLLI